MEAALFRSNSATAFIFLLVTFLAAGRRVTASWPASCLLHANNDLSPEAEQLPKILYLAQASSKHSNPSESEVFVRPGVDRAGR